MHFALSDYHRVELIFGAKSLGNRADVPPPGIFEPVQRQFDGVSISNDGKRWLCIQSLAEIEPQWRQFGLPLDEAAAVLGGFGSKLLIRFSWTGSGIAGSDGLAIDQVHLKGVLDNRVTVIPPAVVVEGAAPVKVRLTRRVVTAQPTTVTLRQTPEGVLDLPASVTFPPRAAFVEFPVSAPDDGLLDPHRKTEVMVTDWLSPYALGRAVITIGDATPLAMSLEIPASVEEGGPAGQGRIHFNRPPHSAITVGLRADPGLLRIPGSVAVPFGAMEASFPIETVDDWLVNGDHEVSITATHAGGSARATTLLKDDDSAALALTVPTTVAEGASMTGTVRLQVGTLHPVTVRLEAGPGLTVEPSTVVISTPPYTADFVLRAPDDAVAGPVKRPVLKATAANFAPAEQVVRVLDNRASSLRLIPLDGLVEAGRPFRVRIEALDSEGEVLSSINDPVSLQGRHSDGHIDFPSVILAGGKWEGSVTFPEAGGIPAELSARDSKGTGAAIPLDSHRTLPGTSYAFEYDSIRRCFYSATDQAEIRAIDPVTGNVLRTVSLPASSALLAITSGCEFLYASLTSRVVAQIDLETFTIVRTFRVNSSHPGKEIDVDDMCTVAGQPDLLVATLGEARSTADGAMVVFDRGVPRPRQIDMFEGLCSLIEPSSDPSLFFGFNPEGTDFSFEHLRLTPEGIHLERRIQGLLKPAQPRTIMRENLVGDGRYVFQQDGDRYDGEALRRLDPLRAKGLVRPDVPARRVYYLAKAGEEWNARYDHIAAYDFDSGSPLFEFRLPEQPDQASSFRRWGATGLAFLADGRIKVIHGHKSLARSEAPADLSVAVTRGKDVYREGEEMVFTADMTNAGSVVAPDSRMRILLERGKLQAISAPEGATSAAGDIIDVSFGALEPGASRRVVLRVKGDATVLVGCAAQAFCAAPEVTPENNLDQVAAVSGFESGRYSFNHLDLAVSDIIHDPVRGLMWLALRKEAGRALGGCLIPLNPSSGWTGDPIRLGADPTKLAISENGTFLYVGLSELPELYRIDLSSGRIDLRIRLGSGSQIARRFSGDMEVLKGDGRSVMVALQEPEFRPPFREVAVFDDGAMRPRVSDGFHATDQIEASSDPDLFFGYDARTTDGVFRFLRVTADGIAGIRPEDKFPISVMSDMRSVGDRVFLSNGDVINGLTGEILGRFATSGAMVPDPDSGRAFFVEYEELKGFNSISAWDSADYRFLFSLELPHAYSGIGYPRSFVRWGENGLAFIFGNSIAIMSDPQLVPSEPRADLSATVEASPEMIRVGDELSYSITLGNEGPYPAYECQAHVRLSVGQSLVSVTGAPYVEVGGWIILQTDMLAVGQTLQATIVTRATARGSLTCSVTATTSSVDVFAENNADFALVTAGYDQSRDSVNVVDLSTADLVADPVRGLVWASIFYSGPGAQRQVVSLDPGTGAIVDRIHVPNMPGSLAISANGRYLYAELLDIGSIQRIDLDEKSPDLLIPLPPGSFAKDIEVLDGDGRSILVAMSQRVDTTGYAGVAVFDDAVKRPLSIGPTWGAPLVNAIERSGVAGQYFGFNLVDTSAEVTRLKLDEKGVSIIERTPGLTTAFAISRTDGDWIFSRSGWMVTGSSPAGAGWFPTSGLPLPALADDRVFFLESGVYSGGFGTARISAYQPWTRVKILDIPMPSDLGAAENFIRVGRDLMAFRAEGKVVFVRSSLLVPAASATDLAVTVQSSPPIPRVDQSCTYTIRVTNHGDKPATGIIVGAKLSDYQTIRTVSGDIGRNSVDGQTIRWEWPELAAGATTTFSTVVVPVSAGLLNMTASVASSAEDARVENNTARLEIRAGFLFGGDGGQLLRQRAMDLVEDPKRKRVWASVPDAGGMGKVISIDPSTGLPDASHSFEGQPGVLALSKNQRYLYVALTDRPSIVRIDLEEQSPDLVFPVGIGNPGAEWRALQMEVLEGQGTSVLVYREDTNWSNQGLVVFDDARPRPVVLGLLSAKNILRASSDPKVFYVNNRLSSFAGLRRVLVDSEGVSMDSTGPQSGLDTNRGLFEVDGDYLVSSIGNTLDMRTWELTGPFIGSTQRPAFGLPWVDAGAKRAYFAEELAIRAYSLDSFSDTGETLPWAKPAQFGHPVRFIRWGQDGFALLGRLPEEQGKILDPGGILFIRWNRAPYTPRVAATAAGPEMPFQWADDPEADQDGDGMADVFEQLFGTPVVRPGANPMELNYGWSTDRFVKIRFPRVAGLPSRPYRYEVSDSLTEWQTPTEVIERVASTSENRGTQMEMIEAQIPKPTQERGFFRLRWIGEPAAE